jgi:diacylglycerol kinase (ATP)
MSSPNSFTDVLYLIPKSSTDEVIPSRINPHTASLSSYEELPILFLFANPVSGSSKAENYLNLKTEQILFSRSDLRCYLYIFNVRDNNIRQRGLAILRNHTQNSIVKVLSAGGDGSSGWLIEELILASIPLSKVEFYVIPYGTGNDLPSHLKWGRKPKKRIIGKNLSSFKDYISTLFNCKETKLDLWEVEAEVEQAGCIKMVQKTSKSYSKQTFKDDLGQPLTTFKRLMTCSFGIGLDGKIGMSFEKHRTTHRSLNKLVYFWQGLKNVGLRSFAKIRDYCYSMTSYEREEGEVIFDRENSVPERDTVLLAMNIKTYLGGDFVVWETARRDLKGDKDYLPQKANDGVLEWLTFSAYGLAVERGVQGNGKRLHQGKGPFVIKLRSPKKQKKVYFQIDGEHFYMKNPKQIRISLSKFSQDLRIMKYHSQ